MFSLDFCIDDGFLVMYTLKRGQKEKDIISFQNAAWKIDAHAYDLLSGRIRPQDFSSIIEASSKLPSFIDEVKSLREFETVKKQTAAHLEECKTQWERNLPITKPFVENLIGHELKGKFTIHMIHPNTRGGTNTGDQNIIWGHYEHWKNNPDGANYHTVYLWHEVLHSFLKQSDLEHSVIELITDEELRTRLNGGSYPPYEGHPELAPVKDKLLPAWREYVKRPSGIYAFVDAQKAKEIEIAK